VRRKQQQTSLKSQNRRKSSGRKRDPSPAPQTRVVWGEGDGREGCRTGVSQDAGTGVEKLIGIMTLRPPFEAGNKTDNFHSVRRGVLKK